MQPGEPPYRILLIEDDEQIVRLFRTSLDPLRFQLTHARGLDTSSLLARAPFDALILGLPASSKGYLAFIQNLRAQGNDIPVLVLARGISAEERLNAFERGADDVVDKCLHINEIVARVRSILRRSRAGHVHKLYYHDLELEVETKTARRPGLQVVLSERETALLAFMMQHPEQELTRDSFLAELWKDEVNKDSNVVNVYVNLLRNKIDVPGRESLIRTVRGIGYMLIRKDPDQIASNPA